MGSVAGRGTGAASGRRPHVRGDGGGARRARGSSGGHNSEAPALVEVGVGRGGSILERVSHPPPLAGPALAARYRKERTLWCGHSRTEEWMSTLAAASIVSSVACTSKGV